MNAMKLRLERILGDGYTSLQHSRGMQALYSQALDKGYNQQEAQKAAREAGALARLHALPVRVMSPYPWLGAAYGLKGHEAVWTDAAGSCFVMDEVHAYDATRLGRVLAMCRRLAGHCGARFFWMSATFPSRFVRLLEQLIPGTKRIEADDALKRGFCRHEVHLFPEDLLAKPILGKIAEFVRSGQSPLIVATTVERAKRVYAELSHELTGLNIPVELLHGRFTGDDRLQKERRLGARRAVENARKEPVVLVATQVVEVSLNVDFDGLFSDPAPLEALLQRFGRVNRQAGMNVRGLRPVYVSEAIPEGDPVYDRRLVELSLAELEGFNGRALDELRIQQILDSIYESATGELWESRTRKAMVEFDAEVLDLVPPFEDAEDAMRKMFFEMFDGFEVLPRKFREEYTRRLRQAPESAGGLLVAVSGKQLYHALGKDLEWVNGLPIVNRDYSAELGLDIGRHLDGV